MHGVMFRKWWLEDIWLKKPFCGTKKSHCCPRLPERSHQIGFPCVIEYANPPRVRVEKTKWIHVSNQVEPLITCMEMNIFIKGTTICCKYNRQQSNVVSHVLVTLIKCPSTWFQKSTQVATQTQTTRSLQCVVHNPPTLATLTIHPTK